MLDQINTHVQLFIQDGSSHCANAMASQLVPTDARSAHRRKNRVIGHRPVAVA